MAYADLAGSYAAQRAQRMSAERARQMQEQLFAAQRASGPNPFDSRYYPKYSQITPGDHWSHILGVKPEASIEEIKSAYRKKAKLAHSDAGGSDAAMSRLNVARDKALRERGK